MFSKHLYTSYAKSDICYRILKKTDIVTVIEALDEEGSRDEDLTENAENYCKNCVRISYYHRTGKALVKHTGWTGYFKLIKQ